jgi:hypothetical protein
MDLVAISCLHIGSFAALFFFKESVVQAQMDSDSFEDFVPHCFFRRVDCGPSSAERDPAFFCGCVA